MVHEPKATAALLVVLAGCVTTHPSPPVAEPLRDLDYFVGNWTLRGEDPSSGKKFALNYRIEPVLDGMWLAGTGESAETSIKVRDFWGHDPATKEVVRIIVDNDGTHGVARAKGWEGETLRFEGTAYDKDGVTAVRETITRLSPAEFKAVWEAKLEKGWTEYSVEHLQRQ